MMNQPLNFVAAGVRRLKLSRSNRSEPPHVGFYDRVGRASRAFTLVELLVVIAIIAVLAGLVAYLLPGVKQKQVIGRIKAEMRGIEAAIEVYKSKLGFYPPDNPNNNAQPPLFYELTGTLRIVTPSTGFEDRDSSYLDTNTIGAYFATSGFLNSIPKDSGPEDEKKKDFYGIAKPGVHYKAIPGSPDVKVLAVPYKGPNGDFNSWRYNSSSPQHNHETYDLWAEVVFGGQTNIIGNWKQ